MPKGFSLIELLVAISIIAIVTTIGFVSYSSAQSTARDAKRKQDLRAIQTGLTLYTQDSTNNKTYPVTTGWVYSNPNNANWNNLLSKKYIGSMPKDPKNTGTNPWTQNQFVYAYTSDVTLADTANCSSAYQLLTGQFYILVAQLENKYDQSGDKTKQYVFCGSRAGGGNWAEGTFIIQSPETK